MLCHSRRELIIALPFPVVWLKKVFSCNRFVELNSYSIVLPRACMRGAPSGPGLNIVFPRACMGGDVRARA